ncbi:MAG: helix-turn-helix domain-containing protein [Alphaproteobacteria bacterium]
MTDMRKLVGLNLARIRHQKGMTQERLSELSGFTQQYLSNIEVGKTNPTIVSIYEIAQALGVNYLDLVRPVRKRQPSKS